MTRYRIGREKEEDIGDTEHKVTQIIDVCWNAVQEAKRATDLYLKRREPDRQERQKMLDLDMHQENLQQRMKR